MKYRNIDRNFRSTVTVAYRYICRYIYRENVALKSQVWGSLTLAQLGMARRNFRRAQLDQLGEPHNALHSSSIRYIQRKCRVEVTSVGLAHARPISNASVCVGDSRFKKILYAAHRNQSWYSTTHECASNYHVRESLNETTEMNTINNACTRSVLVRVHAHTLFQYSSSLAGKTLVKSDHLS